MFLLGFGCLPTVSSCTVTGGLGKVLWAKLLVSADGHGHCVSCCYKVAYTGGPGERKFSSKPPSEPCAVLTSKESFKDSGFI